MPPARHCHRCTARVPDESNRCTICGQEQVRAGRGGLSPRRIKVIGAVLLTLLVGGVIGNATEIGRAMAESYTSMVIGKLPDSAFQMMPMDADERAFYACARAVSRRVGTESSIVTFASRSIAVSETLPDGTIQIRSYLEEAHESGPPRRHTFTCTVERNGERFTVAEAEIALVDGSSLAESSVRAR